MPPPRACCCEKLKYRNINKADEQGDCVKFICIIYINVIYLESLYAIRIT